MAEPRKTLTYHRNGDGTFISLNLTRWQVVMGFLIQAAALAALVSGVVAFVTRPTVDGWIAAQVSPVQAELAEHEAEARELRTAYVLRADLERERTELRQTLQEIADRVEYLYRNEISKAGR